MQPPSQPPSRAPSMATASGAGRASLHTDGGAGTHATHPASNNVSRSASSVIPTAHAFQYGLDYADSGAPPYSSLPPTPAHTSHAPSMHYTDRAQLADGAAPTHFSAHTSRAPSVHYADGTHEADGAAPAHFSTHPASAHTSRAPSTLYADGAHLADGAAPTHLSGSLPEHSNGPMSTSAAPGPTGHRNHAHSAHTTRAPSGNTAQLGARGSASTHAGAHTSHDGGVAAPGFGGGGASGSGGSAVPSSIPPIPAQQPGSSPFHAAAQAVSEQGRLHSARGSERSVPPATASGRCVGGLGVRILGWGCWCEVVVDQCNVATRCQYGAYTEVVA